MKSQKQNDRGSASGITAENRDGIVIRHCRGIPEFEACIRVEREVWKSSDIDIVPTPLFVVASETGGQVLGAFQGADLVGFTLAICGWRARRPFLHSHMTAVLPAHRDSGIGRRLKLYQRTDALARGIGLVEWTFDPLVTKNAYFNFMRLGAIARRYVLNAYGITTSPLHGSLPTDRLVAEWHLRSDRVKRVLAGKSAAVRAVNAKRTVQIEMPANLDELKDKDPLRASQIQTETREDFLKWFKKGYAATAVVVNRSGSLDYILEPWSRI
jgi:predicted GNAT superfamily acetyltransferase